MNRLTSREKGKNAMAELTIPIVVNWDDIKDRMSKGNIVEVIRCKDCHWHYGTICRRNNTMFWNDNDFCGYAEREEE